MSQISGAPYTAPEMHHVVSMTPEVCEVMTHRTSALCGVTGLVRRSVAWKCMQQQHFSQVPPVCDDTTEDLFGGHRPGNSTTMVPTATCYWGTIVYDGAHDTWNDARPVTQQVR